MNTYINLINQQALPNKYTMWYISIILSRKARSLVTGQDHHIAPKSFLKNFNCNDGPDNLVRLTAKEHLICHRLLTKMFTGKLKQKMCYAVHRLCFSHGGDKLSAKKYDFLMKQHAINLTGNGNPMYNRKHSIETKLLIASKATGRKASETTKLKMSGKHSAENNAMYGKKHTIASREKMKSSHAGKHAGENNAFFGKSHTEETKKLIALARLSLPKLECIHCGKYADPANFTRWHGSSCKNLRTV